MDGRMVVVAVVARIPRVWCFLSSFSIDFALVTILAFSLFDAILFVTCV